MTRAETIVWGIVALALAGVVALAVVAREGREPEVAPDEFVDGVEVAGIAQVKTSELLPAPAGDFGDVPGVERSGKPMRTSDLRGRFVVADFIFTYCNGPCPRMTAAMANLQEATKAAGDLVLVTFTVDPDRDTPAELAAYAAQHRAENERWLFLNLKTEDLKALAYDHLQLPGDRSDPFTHSVAFVLADRDGRVRAHYAPLEDEAWLGKLLADLDTLRREPSK